MNRQAGERLLRLTPGEIKTAGRQPTGDSGCCVAFWEIATVTFTEGIPVFRGFLFLPSSRQSSSGEVKREAQIPLG